MSQDVKVVQLVLPEGMRPEAAAPAEIHGTSSWWIAGVAAFVVVGNAALVWWRIRGRAPMQRAFDGVASGLGLSRAERRRVVEASRGKMEPVAMLIAGSALAREGGDEPVMIDVKRKRERAAVSAPGRG